MVGSPVLMISIIIFARILEVWKRIRAVLYRGRRWIAHPRGGAPMLLTNGLLKSLAVAALVFAGSAPALNAQTQNAPSAVNFGMIGLAPSRTLRLNINAWPPDPVYPPTPICIAQLSFANSSAVPVGPAKAPAKSVGGTRWEEVLLIRVSIIWTPPFA
jgi:hypothetical protein